LTVRLEGYCHRGRVHFALDRPHPHPFNLCCASCCKIAGSGDYGFDLGEVADSLEARGEAAATDTAWPTAPERVHLRLGSKAPRVAPAYGPIDQRFDGSPRESTADRHRRLGLGC
jgi:hypothetical protein